MTRAPAALPIWTTVEPTPPLPPFTKSVSPCRSLAQRKRPRCAVRPTSAVAAASSSETSDGIYGYGLDPQKHLAFFGFRLRKFAVLDILRSAGVPDERRFHSVAW